MTRRQDHSTSTSVFIAAAVVVACGLGWVVVLLSESRPVGTVLLLVIMQLAVILALGSVASRLESLHDDVLDMKGRLSPPSESDDAEPPANRWEAVWQAYERQES